MVVDRELDRFVSERRDWIVEANTVDYRGTTRETLDAEEQRVRLAGDRGRCLAARLSKDEVRQMKLYYDWQVERADRGSRRVRLVRASDYVEFRVDARLLDVIHPIEAHYGIRYETPSSVAVVGPAWMSNFADFRRLQTILSAAEVPVESAA